MATFTPRLNLKKPDKNELVDIDDINDNMDTLDGMVLTGSGSPEGNVVANPGIVYLDQDIGSPSPIWAKITGTGNTGWAVFGTGSYAKVPVTYSEEAPLNPEKGDIWQEIAKPDLLFVTEAKSATVLTEGPYLGIACTEKGIHELRRIPNGSSAVTVSNTNVGVFAFKDETNSLVLRGAGYLLNGAGTAGIALRNGIQKYSMYGDSGTPNTNKNVRVGNSIISFTSANKLTEFKLDGKPGNRFQDIGIASPVTGVVDIAVSPTGTIVVVNNTSNTVKASTTNNKGNTWTSAVTVATVGSSLGTVNITWSNLFSKFIAIWTHSSSPDLSQYATSVDGVSWTSPINTGLNIGSISGLYGAFFETESKLRFWNGGSYHATNRPVTWIEYDGTSWADMGVSPENSISGKDRGMWQVGDNVFTVGLQSYSNSAFNSITIRKFNMSTLVTETIQLDSVLGGKNSVSEDASLWVVNNLFETVNEDLFEYTGYIEGNKYIYDGTKWQVVAE